MTKIAILGGGSWGTALSVVLTRARKQHEICIWVHNADLAQAIGRGRENLVYLPGVPIPASVGITNEIRQAVAAANIVVGAMPAAHAREIYAQAVSHCPPETVVVSATKGLEPATHLRMSDVLSHALKLAEPVISQPNLQRIAVLSGPSFAAEAARGEPTAVVIASNNASLATQLQEEFAGPNFRLYTNDDVVGVELAGAMKNVIALAAGACQGLGLGSNALAALITRGLAEMTRLAVSLGAKAETLSGLAGLGDLVLTCTGALSRNRHVGIELGKGRPLKQILAGMRMVAEGVGTTAALIDLSREACIELPITEQVDAILNHGKSPREAIRDIMDRPLKPE
jgi:glycerol-3-phosphate dehydrogenase (NAD(P)+)